MSDFPASAPAANPVFYRTYSRKGAHGRESWQQVVDRNLSGLAKVGRLTDDQVALLRRMQLEQKALPSGRWLWIGGTDWIEKPENVSGAYNCTSTDLVDWRAFALMMDLAMMGSGTGAIIEPRMVDMLPVIRNRLNVTVIGEFGDKPSDPHTTFKLGAVNKPHHTGSGEPLCSALASVVKIEVGDSRKGWVDAYWKMFDLASNPSVEALSQGNTEVCITVDVSKVRPSGEPLKGFGGTANPVKLKDLFIKMAKIFNKALGRKLTSVECCLLTDEAALVVVAGNVRRCLPEDALVHTERGLVPIKDVSVGEYVQTPLGFKRVLNKFDQGVQEVIEIETNSMNPRATATHRVAVFSSALGDYKWKTVSSLEPGDRLLHSDQILTGGVTHLPVDQTAERPAQSRTAKNIVIPDLDVDIAWLIGYTHGNGYVALGRNKHDKPYGAVSWSMNGKAEYIKLKEKLQEKINNALAKFGVQAAHSAIKGENTAVSRCCSIRLAEYFYEHIKKPGTELVVPSFILQGSADIRMAYLAGLVDSDGAINNRPPHLVTTVYGKFARQVGAILSSIGIAGRVSIVTPKEKNWKPKYNITIPAFKKKYNQTIAALSVKGKLKEGLRANGFTLPNTMMRETYNCQEMSSMGFNPSTKINTNVESYIEQSGVDIDIPVTVKGLGSVDYVQTYDIEVEDAHCFYCDGYLTHNSAGIRQFSANDIEASIAKDSLWQQDEDGNWRIDPERDALRMANHTLVYHNYPTREEIVDSVRRQYLSGEGAIMFAPEAIARSNRDILTDKQMQTDFISAYCDHKQSGAEMLKQLDPDCVEDSDKLEHRMGRYGINPCFAPGTMVMTRDGHYPIESLVGKTVEIHDGQKWVKIDNFRVTGTDQPVFNVVLHSGQVITATEYHKFILKNGKRVELKRLKPGMELASSDVRVHGTVAAKGAYLKGFLIGDGTSDAKTGIPICKVYEPKRVCVNRLTESQAEVGVQDLVTANGRRVGNVLGLTDAGYLRALNTPMEEKLLPWCSVYKHEFPVEVYNWIDRAKADFIAGLFDADGTFMDTKNGFAYQLTSVSRKFLEGFGILLTGMGIKWKIGPVRKGGVKDWGERGGICNAQDTYRLTIPQSGSIALSRLVTFERLKSASNKSTVNKVRNKGNVISSVEFSHIAPAVYCCTVPITHSFILSGGQLVGQCGEIQGKNFHCNLAEVHLNRISPTDHAEQEAAFTAAAISVASLLHHKFQEPRYQYSREIDPIVGVSFTGLFDFFVEAFGVSWLEWWAEGRPDTDEGIAYKEVEANYLKRWREIVEETIKKYCGRHGLNCPNRMTTCQPAGTKSLLTGASPGWHPPKAQRFIRRITFRRDDPVALACLDYGYSIVPSQSDKDEQGRLLDDPFDPRCTEWLVEIPTEVSWANLPGADQIKIDQFSALAQFDFYMQVQTHYTRHNTSATIEFREHEIEPLANKIHDAIVSHRGYISAALLARFDANETFPRLPFEPIDKATYERLHEEVLQRRKGDGFFGLLRAYDSGSLIEAGPAGCDSDKCLLPQAKK